MALIPRRPPCSRPGTAGIVVATLLVLAAAGARAEVATPTLDGPIDSAGPAFVQSSSFDLGSVGYMQEEYFLSGTASAFTNVGALGTDGLWTVQPGATAAYKTRIVVYRPTSRRKFNGTVVLEWLNVSGGVDAAPDWTLAHNELIREGYAWVGVSAQYTGVEGGGGLLAVVDLGLKTVNPARYGSLHHPGDSFSYDIYSQAGRAIRLPAGQHPLGDLVVKRVLAIGESQSAFRLVNYINAVHPLARMFDGYLVHSRGAFAVPLSEAPQPRIDVPGEARIRADIDVPVLTFVTETDLTFLGYSTARQDDGPNFRLWEVAGTAHADTYLVTVGPADAGGSPAIGDLVVTSTPVPGIISCDANINSGPQHLVVKAAFAALDRWVRRGKPPRSAPRLELTPGPPVAIARDEYGNARGGIRTPQVDVPIATFTGEQEGSILCRLFGTTTPFDAATLGSLYPSRRAFVSAYVRSLKRAVKQGWIRRADAKLLRRWAASTTVVP